MDIFEKAAIANVHFNTNQGIANPADLYAMPLSALDELTVCLSDELNKENKKSFIKDLSIDNELLQLKFDIAKCVIDHRLKEAEDRRTKQERSNQIQKILAAIEKKKDENLDETSLSQLMKDLKKLQKA